MKKIIINFDNKITPANNNSNGDNGISFSLKPRLATRGGYNQNLNVSNFSLNQVAISMGHNCSPAVRGVELGIRKRKSEGYNTCPFDEMWTNFPGLLKCLNDDFLYFCDKKYLCVINTIHGPMIYNSKYRFIFNHESPGHADLYLSQNWEGGINHFINNNFERFISRYKRRIQAFKNYLLDERNFVTFLISRYNISQQELNLLNSIIRKNYRRQNYNFKIFQANKEEVMLGLTLSQFQEHDVEFTRLNDE